MFPFSSSFLISIYRFNLVGNLILYWLVSENPRHYNKLTNPYTFEQPFHIHHPVKPRVKWFYINTPMFIGNLLTMWLISVYDSGQTPGLMKLPLLYFYVFIIIFRTLGPYAIAEAGGYRYLQQAVPRFLNEYPKRHTSV